MRDTGERDHYYFAQGEKHPLQPDPSRIALDTGHPAIANLPAADRRKVTGEGQLVRRGVRLFERGDLTADELERLDRAGAVLPVFKHRDTLLIVLPEVRVEANDAALQAAVRAFLKSGDVDQNSIEDKGTRFSFGPRSGRGIDALRLSNELHEKLGPDLVQARFLRVVPKESR